MNPKVAYPSANWFFVLDPSTEDLVLIPSWWVDGQCLPRAIEQNVSVKSSQEFPGDRAISARTWHLEVR
jgi:hypothetical protein